ncbi:ribonuclease HI [Clostridiales Family XIII bacterium PM5-7]
MAILKMYTDGGCSGNQNEENFGGWGTILEFGEHKKELYGGQANTTNNRMELTAVIEGFNALTKDNQTIEVFSDSSYVSNCFREKWYQRWEQNNWMNSAKKPVENPDLWKELLALVRKHNVTFYRVKGHVNLNHSATDVDKLYEKFVSWNGERFGFDEFKYITEMNNRADALANLGINQIKGE